MSDAHVVLLLLAPIFGAYFQPWRRPLWIPPPAARAPPLTTGVTRAWRQTFSRNLCGLCRTGGCHEPRDGDLTVYLKRRLSERDRWRQKHGNNQTTALHRTPAGLDLRIHTH